MSTLFSRAAHWFAEMCGRPVAFMIALLAIVIWATTGPMFHYSDTWQLIINTGTTIVTFLMVFVIQNTQNRDTAAIQLKLDELIHSSSDARDRMMCLEDLTEEELKRLKETFVQIVSHARPETQSVAAAE
ncbi:low affinity iron permease family protein [Rhodopila sp.]|uniref:low affinity iron permease family protein n=1 Tax=Rhodopila sp. TaxID=2480087 RepID=UPI002BF4CB8D|nr:low affinity iron permease family protein [Rhodopila sp.]HVZ07946.1 low affinity iron permease family protein [Rhodopila sp.]